MDFGAYPVGRRFTIQREYGPLRGLPAYVFKKETRSSARAEKTLPGISEDLFQWAGHEVFFPADFPIIPYYEPARKQEESECQNSQGPSSN